MVHGPLLLLYRKHLAEADFSGAKIVLDTIEQQYANRSVFAEIVASERERLERHGLVLAPSHNSRDHLPTQRAPSPGIDRARQQEDHNWYFNDELETCLNRWWRCTSPAEAASSPHSLLVLGNNFSLSTGVFRPISHYLNFLHHHGGMRLHSVQLADDACPDLIKRLIDQHDTVLINGLQQICNVRHLARAVEEAVTTTGRNVHGYLHETAWILDRLPEDQKQRIRNTIPHLDLLLCCQRQRDDFAPYGLAKSHTIIHNPTLNISSETSTQRGRRNSSTVLMVGTVKERKGVDLFNSCASQLTPHGFRFSWAGQIRDQHTILGNDVRHLGHLGSQALQRILAKTDVFFLSSLEDTFPLSAVEAYLHGCKILLPRTTGLVDLMNNRSGVLVYDHHDVDAVEPLLKTLRDQPPPTPSDRRAIASCLGLQAFIDRIHRPLITNVQATQRSSAERNWPGIAVVAHLYYTDLVYELSRQFQAVAGPTTDLYITVPTHKQTPDLISRLERMFLSRFRSVQCISVPNRGMDVGPFFEVIRRIQAAAANPVDLILKVHTKKSLRASGADKGKRWRRGLLNGLLGNRDNVQSIINCFEQNPDLGVLAPERFLMVRSQRDQTTGANDQLVKELLETYQLPEDIERPFVRGTMFWARRSTLLQELQRSPLPELNQFEAGHATDGSLAHAYERLLPYLLQRHQPAHPHQPVSISP